MPEDSRWMPEDSRWMPEDSRLMPEDSRLPPCRAGSHPAGGLLVEPRLTTRRWQNARAAVRLRSARHRRARRRQTQRPRPCPPYHRCSIRPTDPVPASLCRRRSPSIPPNRPPSRYAVHLRRPRRRVQRCRRVEKSLPSPGWRSEKAERIDSRGNRPPVGSD